MPSLFLLELLLFILQKHNGGAQLLNNAQTCFVFLLDLDEFCLVSLLQIADFGCHFYDLSLKSFVVSLKRVDTVSSLLVLSLLLLQ